MNDVSVAPSGGGEIKAHSPVASLPKPAVSSPVRYTDKDIPVSTGRSEESRKKEEDDGDEVSESEETESEESSEEEEEDSTTFVEYEAEPLSKTRTQSRSVAQSVAENGDLQHQSQAPHPDRFTAPLEVKLPVATATDRSLATLVSPVGKASQFSVGSSDISSDSRSPGWTGKLEDWDSKLAVTAATPEQIPVLSMSPGTRVSPPSPVVNTTEFTYAGKFPKSPTVKSSVSVEPDTSGKPQRSPIVRSPVPSTESGHALKFQPSPTVPVDNSEPIFARRLPSYARSSPPMLEYAEFDSEPMMRNRQNIPYADDDDELSPAPEPTVSHKPSSPPVKTPTLITTRVPLTAPLVAPPNFVQSYEAPPVVAPRAAAGPVLMPPPVSAPTARIEASPVLRNPKPIVNTSQDNCQPLRIPVPTARTQPPSVSRASPHATTPKADTDGPDAVSQLFMKLETNYSKPSPPQMPVQSREPSYGPGYRPPSHGAVVQQQEPYPVEVWQLLLYDF